MKKMAQGGYNVYGYDIGVLMLDSSFPRIKGDIGNATTWGFPVRYKVVKNWKPAKVVLELTPEDVQPFIDAAKELEREGVRAITTSCGFLSLFQTELANAVDIPVFTSALLMVPMIKRMIGTNQKVGVLTANRKTLSERHLKEVGVNPADCIIEGLEDEKSFTNFTVQNWDEVDLVECKKELIKKMDDLLERDSKIGAIVLECTNMPPYAYDLQRRFNIPIFDIVSLTNLMYDSFNKSKFIDWSERGVDE